MTMLSARDLSIGYPRRTLAGNISFTLNAGEAVAILGPNGSGKTTLFRTLLGLLPARAGQVLLADKIIAALTPAEIARHIAYVPQAAGGFFNFSVIEVVEMARAAHLAWYAQPGARDRAIAEQALAELNIADFADREFAELSGGERQLVMIARALASEAAILLLDEPTASLDYGNQFLILDEIAKLKARGVAILFTTHDPNQALRIADRTLTISRTGAVTIGNTHDLLTGTALAALYGLPIQLIPGPDGPLTSVSAVRRS
jgi:iron complex transport system ATP-binding protein